MRFSEINRKTKETDIQLKFEVDGKGVSDIETGIGFLNHMLTLFARHGLFNLSLRAVGDLDVDAHHTVEDIGIVLGQAIREAAGDKVSIKRYGSCLLPMDEALAMVALDLGGRPFLAYDAQFTGEKAGGMETALLEEFFRALAVNSGLTLHIKLIYGSNDHHIAEAIFKAFSRALDQALQKDMRIDGVMSTKGSL